MAPSLHRDSCLAILVCLFNSWVRLITVSMNANTDNLPEDPTGGRGGNPRALLGSVRSHLIVYTQKTFVQSHVLK